MKRKRKIRGTAPYIAPEVAKGLEKSQISMYHTKGGTGFAAEDANAFADRIRMRNVELTGTSFEKDGADRVVDSQPIQTKYYPKAGATVESAFDTASGQYRYGQQILEVPKDQYEECVRIMREKIAAGKVPGVTDPNAAQSIVRQGDVTYKQARNIARAGNIDSILFDAKTQSITTAYVFAVTFAIYYAKRKWDGEKTEDAINGAIESAIAAGGTTLVTGIITAQILRTRVAALGVVAARNGVKAVSHSALGKKAVERLAQASLGKAVYGAAAINRVAKLLRSNMITTTVATAVTSTPDFCRAAFSKSISWPQFSKNLIVNAGGIAGGAGGWMGGAAAGAAVGSAVPVIGTVVGGIAGGVIGAVGGGWFGTTTTKGIMDVLIEDDAKEMVRLLRSALVALAGDYLLSEAEIQKLSQTVKRTVSPKWLRTMYQAGSKKNSSSARKQYAYQVFERRCQSILTSRQRVTLPPTALVQDRIAGIVKKVSSMAELRDNGAAVFAS